MFHSIRKLAVLCRIFCCAILLLSRTSLAQTIFEDVSPTTGPPTISARSTAFGDYDNDGDLDLLTAQPHFLFLNNGDVTFVERTDQSGMEPMSLGPPGRWTCCAISMSIAR